MARSNIRFAGTVIAHGILWVGLFTPEARAQFWEVTSLGGFNTHDINNSGQVLLDTSGFGSHSFVFDTVNGLVDLGTLGGNQTEVFRSDINNLGQVAGTSQLSSGEFHAFLWDRLNGMEDLGTLGGVHSVAYGINDSGQAVGYSETASGDFVPFLWDSVNGMRNLGISGTAYAINSSGQVVGTGGPDGRAFLWDSVNGVRYLNGANTQAVDINDLGQVTGVANNTDQAFVWDSVNGLRDVNIGTLQEAGNGINNSGYVVGTYQFEPSNDGPLHAFLWNNGVASDIHPDGLPSSAANAVNDS